MRIQGMARQHGITLRREFDDKDTPETKYIVLTDDDFPVATCRINLPRRDLPDQSDRRDVRYDRTRGRSAGIPRA